MRVVKAGLAGLVLGTCFPLVVVAVPITGSFSGVADGWRRVETGQQRRYENEPISGAFEFESSFDRATEYEGPGSVMYFNWPVSLTFNLFGYSYSFDPDPGSYAYALTLEEAGPRETTQLWFFAAYANASLTFAAPNGGLFDNFDPRTFNPGAIDVAASRADFSGDTRNEYASVRFDRITFDGFEPTPVPEPLTVSLFAAGLLGIGLMRRRNAPSKLL